jgi:hypothetical protein
VDAYVIITVDHMASNLLYLKVQDRHIDMFYQDWPIDRTECDEHGQYSVERHTVTKYTNLTPRHSQETGQRARAGRIYDSLSICSTNKCPFTFTLHQKIERSIVARTMRLQVLLVMISCVIEVPISLFSFPSRHDIS